MFAFAALRSKIRAILLSVFAAHASKSVQHTFTPWAKPFSQDVPEMEDIELTMPNRHYLLADLSRFGQDNPNEIFVPTDEPHGTSRRAFAGKVEIRANSWQNARIARKKLIARCRKLARFSEDAGQHAPDVSFSADARLPPRNYAMARSGGRRSESGRCRKSARLLCRRAIAVRRGCCSVRISIRSRMPARTTAFSEWFLRSLCWKN